VLIALQLGYYPIAQRANHFFWLKYYEITKFSLNLFFLNASSHDRTIA